MEVVEDATQENTSKEVLEKADSTTETTDDDRGFTEGGDHLFNAGEGGGGENRVTSSDNGTTEPIEVHNRKRQRSEEDSKGCGDNGKRSREDYRTSNASDKDSSDGRSFKQRCPEDARSRIEDRRRGRAQEAAATVEDYVSRADRARVGKDHRYCCVVCNLVFVSARSEKLHRDSQRHRFGPCL